MNLTIKGNIALSPRETAQYLNISYSTLWRFVKRADFPQPRRLTPRTIRFLKSDIDAYLQGKGA